MINKFLYIGLATSLAFIFTSNSVMAQTSATDVSATRIEATTAVPVGGESEDIGAPEASVEPVGIEHEDIGGATSGSSKSNVEATLKVEEGEAGAMKSDDLKMMTDQSMPGDEIMVLLRPSPGADEESTTTTRMSKSDLIESLHESRAVFVKLGDIKGESSDEGSAESSLNSQLDSEEATRAKKPREIVVVGSKVRGDNVPQLVSPDGTPLHSFDVFFDVEVISSDEDVELYAVGIAQSDEDIKDITITDEKVGLRYKTQLRMFGFLPVTVSQLIEVSLVEGDEYGRVKVQLPWWHVFGRKIVKPVDLQLSLEEGLGEVDRPSESISLSFQKIQAQTLQTISNVSKMTHDVAMNSIRNLK